jgi:hypothetical protein
MFAVLCLVSTVAVAVEMTCRASDGKGNCTAATGPDGREVVVVGEGLKPGDIMECVDRGTLIDCMAQVSPEDKAAEALSRPGAPQQRCPLLAERAWLTRLVV